MARSINFVAERRKRLSKSWQLDRRLFRYSLYAFGGIFLIFLVTVGIRFFFVFQVDRLQEQQEQLSSSIVEREEIEKEYTIFVHKLKALKDLFVERQDKQAAINFFSELFEDDVRVVGLEYDKEEEYLLTMTVQTPSVFVLDRVFEKLESPELLEAYPSVKKQSVVRNKDGKYSLSIAVDTSEGAADAEVAGENDGS